MDFQHNNTVSLIYKNLKKGDYEVKPFKTHKKWNFASDSSETFAGVPTFYENSGIRIYRALYPENHKYFGGIANISSSLYERTFVTQSVDPKLIWYQLDHNYYANFERGLYPTNVFLGDINRNLYESSSVMVIPQKVFGEGIKKGTFSINHYGTESPFNYTLSDDSSGNLIDSEYDTSKFANYDKCLLYLGFNAYYRSYGFRNKQTDGVVDGSQLDNEVVYISPKKISFVPGITTTSPVSSSGTAIALNGGYLQVMDKENFDMAPKDDFAISFWINVPVSQSNYTYYYNHILNKSSTRLVTSVITSGPGAGGTTTSYQKQGAGQWPFDITVNNSSAGSAKYKLNFTRGAGTQAVTMTTNTALPTGSWAHVVCQKSGSQYGIYLNGVIDVSQSIDIRGAVSNDNEMYIGGEGLNDSGSFSGSLDEFRIYKGHFTPQQISGLSDNSFDLGYAYQTNVVGNIFYTDGIAVVSDPRPKYKNALLGKTGNYDYGGRADGFYGTFKSTTTFYEHEIICRLRKNEYNMTQNPSIVEGGIVGLGKIRDFTTSSYFNPYFTTIGLYNDKYELIAIAKTSSPIEKRDDVDMNVIIRFDV
jgi:hypothetical protein